MTVELLNWPIEFNVIQLTYDHEFDTDTVVIASANAGGTRRPIRTVDDEKRAFLLMLPSLEASHAGKHVIIENGIVADVDDSRRELVRRFFSQPRPGPIYIGFVGTRPPVIKAPTPFIRHRPAQP